MIYRQSALSACNVAWNKKTDPIISACGVDSVVDYNWRMYSFAHSQCRHALQLTRSLAAQTASFTIPRAF